MVLLLSTWLYFGLDHAVFGFPWFTDTGGRVLSAWIFAVCAVSITMAALIYGWRSHGVRRRTVEPAEQTVPDDDDIPWLPESENSD